MCYTLDTTRLCIEGYSCSVHLTRTKHTLSSKHGKDAVRFTGYTAHLCVSRMLQMLTKARFSWNMRVTRTGCAHVASSSCMHARIREKNTNSLSVRVSVFAHWREKYHLQELVKTCILRCVALTSLRGCVCYGAKSYHNRIINGIND
jgi:hypothetical protein